MVYADFIIHRLAGTFVFAARGLHHGGDGAAHAIVIIAGPEVRLDFVFDNLVTGRVWQGTFETVADLDISLPVIDEDKEHGAVFAVFPAHAPALGDSHGV